ncbi:hypothetical protein BGX27_000035 [Mortierella sp. AM989]|nr:hypothetical protein BGX27_000035 [Mortierella sp. AM989]
MAVPPPQFRHPSRNANNVAAVNNNNNYEPETDTDIWDDDFAGGIPSFQLAAREFLDQEDEVSKTIRAAPKALPIMLDHTENDIDENDSEDDDQELHLKIRAKALGGKKKLTNKQHENAIKPGGSLAARTKNAGSHVPIDLIRSRSAPGQLALVPLSTDEGLRDYREEEEIDYSDGLECIERRDAIFQDGSLTLQTRLSDQSWFGKDTGSDEEDPFAEMDEGLSESNLEANIARGKYAKICGSIGRQFRLLEQQQTGKQLEAVCDRLINLLVENPDIRAPMIANHGAIPLLDLIENSSKQQSLTLKLLNILNLVIRKDLALQESLCLVGAIPVLIRYTSKQFSKEIQLAAAIFIQQICHANSLTLQMFISCRGLRVLIDFLQGNYSTQKDLVWIAINGIHSVFNLQSMTPRNDFCRLLAKQGLLEPLSVTLYNTMRDPQGSSYTEKIVQVFLIFSQGDFPVKELLAERKIVHRMLNSLQSLPPNLCVMMLKCIKNVSLNFNTLDELQNASAIHTLVQVLGEHTGSSATDVRNHVLTTLFNLCRINKSRQEEAAQAGIIPYLQQIAESTSPLKQFALPILCEMAHAGRACRNILWNNDCLLSYLRILKDPYWQLNAMDAIHVWLQDETADVEQVLLQPSSLSLIVQAFLTAKANSFENILEPLYKIIRLSPKIACGIAVPAFFQRLLDRLAHPKALVRGNLVRILHAIFRVHPERIQLVVRYGIVGIAVKIAKEDISVVTRGLAKDILVAFEESDSEAVLSSDERYGGKDRGMNGYDGFASTGDVFGLDPLRDLFTANEKEEEWNEGGTPLQQHTVSGKFKDRSPNLDQHHVDDLFQQEVDGLDIQTSLDPRRSSHHRGFGLEGNSEGANAQLRHRLTAAHSFRDDEGSDNSSGSEEQFVTSRAWIDEQESSTVILEQGNQTTADEEQDLEDNEPRTIKVSRQFGHQKSKSLGEILGKGLERSHLRLLEGTSTDMSESMILRGELPKIRLELLDIDRSPARNRRELEAKYENDEGGGSDNVKGTGRGGVENGGRGISRTFWSESHQDLRSIGLRGIDDEFDITTEEQNRTMKRVQGTRRRLSMDDHVRSSIRTKASGSRRASGSNSSEPTVRFQGTPFASMSSPAFFSSSHMGRQPPSLASIVGWNVRMPGTMAQEAEEESSSPGLVLIKPQEYDATLDFSDDDSEDDGDVSDENEVDNDEDGIDGNDDDNNDEDEDTYQSAGEDDDYDDHTIKANVIAQISSNRNTHAANYSGSNDYDDNDFDDNDNQTHSNSGNWNRSPERESNHDVNYGGYLMDEGEIDWDREEVRKGCDSPLSTMTTTSAVTSPTSSTSTLRRRSSHRKSPE